MSGPERAAYAAKVAAAQNEVAAQIEAMGGQVLVRFKTLSSGLGAMIPANKVMDVANLDRVAHLGAVNDYQLDLSETVPFIGASVLQNLDITGWGVDVAVLDSGVDYTHLAFAGPGTVEAYDAAYFGDNCPTYKSTSLPVPTPRRLTPTWSVGMRRRSRVAGTGWASHGRMVRSHLTQTRSTLRQDPHHSQAAMAPM